MKKTRYRAKLKAKKTKKECESVVFESSFRWKENEACSSRERPQVVPERKNKKSEHSWFFGIKT